MADPSVDLSEMDELVADLGNISHRLVPTVIEVLERGAYNVKSDWADNWSRLDHAPLVDESISYDDVEISPQAGDVFGVISVEIGPDKNRPQGDLGNLLEFGSVNNAPIPGGGPALDAEQPRLIEALADAGVASVFGRR